MMLGTKPPPAICTFFQVYCCDAAAAPMPEAAGSAWLAPCATTTEPTTTAPANTCTSLLLIMALSRRAGVAVEGERRRRRVGRRERSVEAEAGRGVRGEISVPVKVCRGDGGTVLRPRRAPARRGQLLAGREGERQGPAGKCRGAGVGDRHVRGETVGTAPVAR